MTEEQDTTPVTGESGLIPGTKRVKTLPAIVKAVNQLGRDKDILIAKQEEMDRAYQNQSNVTDAYKQAARTLADAVSEDRIQVRKAMKTVGDIRSDFQGAVADAEEKVSRYEEKVKQDAAELEALYGEDIWE